MVGRVYGGLGITCILACTFFAAISGSGPGTVAAVGTLLIPAMVKNGYSKDYAAAVASSGGTIGILIPPSNPMIIYAILGNLSVTAMFTAGFIPGALVAVSMMTTAYIIARRKGFKGAAGEFVGKIRLRQSVSGKNFVIADVLGDWSQAEAAKGDVIFAD
jgi:C4-dicarboxylate transporter DctM subunit